MKKYTKVKDLINDLQKLNQEALIVIGENNDDLGRNDKDIKEIIKSDIGFDEKEIYYKLIGYNFGSEGALR